MSQIPAPARVSIEAKSPFELRVNLGRDVPDSTVRSALASGDMGFLHSFTTGRHRRWSRRSCRRLDYRLPDALPLLP